MILYILLFVVFSYFKSETTVIQTHVEMQESAMIEKGWCSVVASVGSRESTVRVGFVFLLFYSRAQYM